MSYAPQGLPPLEFSLRGARSALVLDPAVLLCHPASAVLVRQLARVHDLWVPPGLWRLLDASEFYGRNPRALQQWLGLPEACAVEQVMHALQLWGRLRMQRDVGSMDLYWVHDSQTEAYLAEQAPRDLALRFETLALALQGQETDEEALGPAAGQVDIACECAALAASLDGAPILTLAGTAEGQSPGQARSLQTRGLVTRNWPASSEAAQLEHAQWRQTVSQAGASASVALLPALSLVRVLAPQALCLEATDRGPAWGDEALDIAPGDWPSPSRQPDYWQDAHAFWTNP